MPSLLNRFNQIIVNKKLKMGKGAQIIATDAAGAETVVDMTELAALGGVTASAAELNVTDGALATNAVAAKAAIIGSDASLTVGGVKQAPVFVADATPYTVLAANSGKRHVILEQASNITLNLPVIAAGLSFKFILGGVATEAQNWIIVATTPSFYNGGVVWLDSDNAADNVASVYGNGSSHLTLTAVTPEAGTAIEIYSNGTEWFVAGTITSATTPTFT